MTSFWSMVRIHSWNLCCPYQIYCRWWKWAQQALLDLLFWSRIWSCFSCPLSFEKIKHNFCHITIQQHNSKRTEILKLENTVDRHVELLNQINSMDIKLLFLTSYLLNIPKAFPRHIHFKPLSENGGTHTVPLQNRVYQSYISSTNILFSVLFSTWLGYTKKKHSVI